MRSTSGIKTLEWFASEAKNIDVGLYDTLYKEGKTLTTYLEDLKASKVADSPYMGMTMEEIYLSKMNQRVINQPVKLTAYEELLSKAGLAVSGPMADTVSKFFNYADTDILFPEFIANRVYAGLLAESLIPKLVTMETILTDGLEYRKIYINDSEAERQTGIIGKGAELGETQITVADQSVKLTKYGRYLSVAFEDIEYTRLNVFGRALERIGMQIQIDMTDELIYNIINGDGNSNTPGTTVETDASGTIAVKDVIDWANALPTPYKMTDFVGRKALINEYLATLAGMNYQVSPTGQVVGIQLPVPHEWDRDIVTSDRFFGIDKRYSMEMITKGGVQTMAENIVKKLSKGTAVWHWCGFAVIDKNANAIFDETH